MPDRWKPSKELKRWPVEELPPIMEELEAEFRKWLGYAEFASAARIGVADSYLPPRVGLTNSCRMQVTTFHYNYSRTSVFRGRRIEAKLYACSRVARYSRGANVRVHTDAPITRASLQLRPVRVLRRAGERPSLIERSNQDTSRSRPVSTS